MTVKQMNQAQTLSSRPADSTVAAHVRGGASKTIAILFSSNVAAAAILFAASPALTRLFSPEGFGELAVVMGIVSLGAAIVHGRYHLALPRSASAAEALALLTLASLLSLVGAPIVALAGALLLGKASAGWHIAAMAAPLIAASALLDVHTYWRSYRARFRASANNTLVRAAATAAGQVGMGLTQSGSLVLGTLLGTLAALATSVYDVTFRDRQTFTWPNWPEVWRVLRVYAAYPLFSMPQGLLAAASWNVFPILLFQVGGPGTAGLYWLALRLAMAAYNAVDGAYRQVVLGMLGDGATERTPYRQLLLHTALLLAGGLAGTAMLTVWGRDLFAIVFGESWRDAGGIAVWLAVAFTAEFAKLPASCLLQARGRLGQALAWEIGVGTIRYAAAVPALMFVSAEAGIIAYATAGAAGWAAFTVATLIQIRR